jgi:hypothetical protein
MAETPAASSPNDDEALPPVVESPIVLTYECDGTPKAFHARQTLVDEFSELFPKLDVVEHLREALAWTKAKPGNRKSHRGMRSFLTNWLTRANDKYRSSGSGPPTARQQQSFRVSDEAFAE